MIGSNWWLDESIKHKTVNKLEVSMGHAPVEQNKVLSTLRYFTGMANLQNLGQITSHKNHLV